jgi:hypothetical protein
LSLLGFSLRIPFLFGDSLKISQSVECTVPIAGGYLTKWPR